MTVTSPFAGLHVTPAVAGPATKFTANATVTGAASLSTRMTLPSVWVVHSSSLMRGPT